MTKSIECNIKRDTRKAHKGIPTLVVLLALFLTAKILNRRNLLFLADKIQPSVVPVQENNQSIRNLEKLAPAQSEKLVY